MIKVLIIGLIYGALFYGLIGGGVIHKPKPCCTTALNFKKMDSGDNWCVAPKDWNSTLEKIYCPNQQKD